MVEEGLSTPDLGPVSPDSEILSTVAAEVPVGEIASAETQAIIDGMFKVAYGEQGDAERKTMVGLAAPQVGVGKRIIIAGVNAVSSGEQPELRAYVNPVIIEESDEREDGREGCYSTGKVCGVVNRASKVTVRAYDRYGNTITETYEGFPARVFQHEIDHLDGIRFPERITDEAKLHWVEPDKFGEYRERWAEWEILCRREDWDTIKSGAKT